MTDETTTAVDNADAVKDEVKEAANDTVEVVPDPVQEASDKVNENTDDIPPWGKELSEKVDSISSHLESLVTAPMEAQDPADGEVITDEAPVKLPWTHRPLFGGKG